MSVFHNNALIGAGGGTAAAAAAGVATKSLRFNSGDSASLTKTFGAGNRSIWTWSGWVKRSKIGGSQILFSSFTGSASDYIIFSNDTIAVQLNSSNSGDKITTRVLRDCSSWYHIVVAADYTSSTANDRIKIYINGVLETAFGTNSAPSQNYQGFINHTYTHAIGSVASSTYLDGYLADVYFIDGSQLNATSFGAFDDNGVWQAAEYSGTFGTNGFHLLDFANEATIGHDSSGNENDFTAYNFNATGTREINTFGSISTSVSTEPFSGAGGAVGGGTTSDYVQVPAHSDFSLDGVFTVEWWHYRSSSSTNTFMWTVGDSQTATGLELYWGSNGTSLNLYTNDGASQVTATSATGWKHYAVVRDSSNNIKVYYHGTLALTVSNSNTFSGAITFGEFYGGSVLGGLLGPISNFRLVKGSAVYTSNFTPPTSALSAITNTKLLTFQGSTIADASGVNLSAERDVLFDVPTNDTTNTDSGAGGQVSGNYATLNPVAPNGLTLANGGLDGSGSDVQGHAPSTIFASSGKFYCEFTLTTYQGDTGVGVAASIANSDEDWIGEQAYMIGYLADGRIFQNSSSTSYSSYAAGDVIGAAFDADTGKVWFHKNGTYQNSGNPAAGTGQVGTITGGYALGFTFRSVGGAGSFNFGQRAFAHNAPSGFKSLNTASMSAATISDGSDYFDIKLYTGNGATTVNGSGSTQTISGYGFAPGFLWIKDRSAASDHNLANTILDAPNLVHSNKSDQLDTTSTDGLTGFTSDGFTLGDNNISTGNQTLEINKGGNEYVAWAWATASSDSTNTDGSISSTVRANQTAGCSIVQWTGTASSGTVGHGLGASPDLILVKNYGEAADWMVWHSAFGTAGSGDHISLNSAAAKGSPSRNLWNNTLPTNSVFSVGSDGHVNSSGKGILAHCFSAVAGFSAVTSFVGNGSTSGAFCHLGFRPRFILYKSQNTSDHWNLLDTVRSTYNPLGPYLQADNNIAEGNASLVEIYSNGFRPIFNLGNQWNGSGQTYIVYAVAENPFQANGGLAR